MSDRKVMYLCNPERAKAFCFLALAAMTIFLAMISLWRG